MNRMIWKVLLVVGICPLVIPVLLGLYHMSIETWTMLDWLLLWSVIYWPTYVVGLALIFVAIYKLKVQS